MTALVPMVPNFLPNKGLGLKVMERGGEGLVRDAYMASQHMVLQQERLC